MSRGARQNPLADVCFFPRNLHLLKHFEYGATRHDFGACHAFISIGTQMVQAVTFGVQTKNLN